MSFKWIVICVSLMLVPLSICAGVPVPQNGCKSFELDENWVFDYCYSGDIFDVQVAYLPSAFPEIICNRGNKRISIISYEFGSNGFVQRWISDLFPDDDKSNEIVLLEYENLNDFGFDEILVIGTDGIYLFDRPSRTLIKNVPWSSTIASACVGDYNRDGTPELILGMLHDGIQFVNLDTFEIENQFDDCAIDYDSGMVMGQVDDDLSMELIVNDGSGYGGYVLDLDSMSVEWVHFPDFGWKIKLNDIDGDGKEEMITNGVADQRYFLQVFDIDEKSKKWENVFRYYISGYDVDDLDDDGQIEIIASCTYDRIYIIDAQTGEIERQSDYLRDPFDEVAELRVADVDLDGQKEIIGFHPNGYWGQSFAINPFSMEIEWVSQNPEYNLRILDVADVDKDGIDDIVFITNDNMFIYDGARHRKKIIQEINWSSADQFKLCDLISSSAPPELIAMTYYNLEVRDILTLNTCWVSGEYYDCSTFTCFDIDEDSELEVIAGVQYSYEYNSNHIVVLDGTTGSKKWESMEVVLPNELRVSDIDNDGRCEIGGLTAGNNFYLMKYMSDEYEWEFQSSDIEKFEFADVYPNIPGIEIIFAIRESYDRVSIEIRDGINHSIITSFDFNKSQIIDILADDFDKDGTTELCLATSSYVCCTNLQGEILWDRYTDDESVNHVIFRDINNDNVNELLIISRNCLHEYRIGGVSPEPTPDCKETGIKLNISSQLFHSGDVFHLECTACNTSDQVLENQYIFILLDVYGEFWFAPSWINSSDGIDYYTYSIPPGGWWFDVTPYFEWPDVGFSASGIRFWGAFVNSAMTGMIGELDQVTFGWR